MIKAGNVRDLNPDEYDENWLIVRKPDEIPPFVRHEPLLSPSPDLFSKYRAAFEAGIFDQNFFDQIYVPQFMAELAVNQDALAVLETLVNVSNSKNIFLACYCETESMCHRSIIAGMLLGMGARIDTVPAYMKYFEMYEKLIGRM